MLVLLVDRGRRRIGAGVGVGSEVTVVAGVRSHVAGAVGRVVGVNVQVWGCVGCC